jgi:hypothetical protein
MIVKTILYFNKKLFEKNASNQKRFSAEILTTKQFMFYAEKIE